MRYFKTLWNHIYHVDEIIHSMLKTSNRQVILNFLLTNILAAAIYSRSFAIRGLEAKAQGIGVGQ